MYCRGSVVGKASTIGIGISPTPLLIFTGGLCEKLSVGFNITEFDPPAFENAARYPGSETNFLCSHDRSMSLPSLVKLGPRTLKNLCLLHHLNLHGENVLNRQ